MDFNINIHISGDNTPEVTVRKERRSSTPERPCVNCGTVFKPKVHNQKCCSKACIKEHRAIITKQWRARVHKVERLPENPRPPKRVISTAFPAKEGITKKQHHKAAAISVRPIVSRDPFYQEQLKKAATKDKSYIPYL